ncbi:hypothetical protein GC163_12625 [bacterium]|nr:hypothetical protein [bacterium]
MTNAERQKAYRARIKAEQPTHPLHKLRWELFRFVESWRLMNPSVTADEIKHQLIELGMAISLQEYREQNNIHLEPTVVDRYLAGEDLHSRKPQRKEMTREEVCQMLGWEIQKL